jgi:peptidyl-prolyl cis-trans isomerase C
MRSLTLTTALTAAVLTFVSPFGTVIAQAAKPAPAAPAIAPQAQKNPLIATVNGEPIKLSDIAAWVDTHVQPEQRAQIGQEKLFTAALDNLVSGMALQVMARKQGLDKDPAVSHQMQMAADEVLQRALLVKTVLPMVTEDAIKAQYDKQFASKTGEEEVHARHILVDSEAKAQDIIKQLQAGAKFEDLAKKYGDPKDAATQQGGDLGWFKKGDMLPEFSDVAFKLGKNQYTTTPVHTRYGWHVIQVLDTRVSQPPTYDAVHDEIKQQLLRMDAQQLAAQARGAVKIVQYGPDGKPLKPQTAPPAPVKK